MIIHGISIRLKLLLATLVTLVLLVVLTVIFLDSSQRISSGNGLLESRSLLLSEMRSLEQSVQQLIFDREDEWLAASLRNAREVESQVSIMAGHEILKGKESIGLKASQVRSAIAPLVQDLRLPASSDTTNHAQVRTDLVVLGELVNELDQLVSAQLEYDTRQHRHQLIVAMILGIFIIGAYLALFSLNIGKAFSKLTAFTGKLSKGQLPPSLDFVSGDEFGQLARDLNQHVSELNNKINHINSLTEEGSREIDKPGEEDELGNALVVLSGYMTRKELDEVTRNREDKKQNWISEGVAQLGEVLRSERENMVNLSYSIIQKLVTYMNVEMGSLFVTNDSDPQNLTLDLTASYAYDRRKYQSRSLQWGVGLPGTCAQEKKRIFLTDIPADYFEISSGTGSSRPNCLLLVPMMIDDMVYGVIELATVRLLQPFEIDFVESLAESIASSLMAVRTNERTAELLKQSQAQAEALKSQETAMLENMKKLEEAQAESGKKETEITGILNAINQSTLVAELGLNGRYTSVNDRFLLLLESERGQVLGKQHREFAQVDPYSDEYKKFWSTLKQGESISNMEMYKIVSGKEVWLQQTFTPIQNNEGKVYKILNIATDITETRLLQEQLESRELEITRRNLDMQTLNEAVNSALIKCELDAEGIIMVVNDNYTEVTGYGRKELLGRNYRLFLKDAEKEQFEKIWEEISKQKVYEGVVRRTRPTGEEVWLVSTFSPVIDEGGVVYKVYFMGLDITEKKLKYQLLEDANKEIERLKDRLNEFET